MRQIKLATDNFDTLNTFNLNILNKPLIKCSLQKDYDKVGDGIYWALSKGACVQSNYSLDQIAESKRLAKEASLENGDVVLINDEKYAVRVLGAYSDAAIFDPI